MPTKINPHSYPNEYVIDPASPLDMIVGEPVALGLFANWTLLAATITSADEREGVMLAVRPHRYHPYVTERFGFRADDGAFIVWSGTYHETLAEAISEFADRGGKIEIRHDRPDNPDVPSGHWMELRANWPIDHAEGE